MIRVYIQNGGAYCTINGGGHNIKGNISQEVGAINSFSFTIYPNNPGYDILQSRKTKIKAVNEKTGRTEFEGRVLLLSEKMESSGLIYKSVTCEGFLGYLCDSIQPYAEEKTLPLNDFIDWVLENHNAQVEDEKKIYRGDVDVEVAGTGNVTKGLQYQTTYETLKTKLVDIFGGELEVVNKSDKLYLNYLKQIGETRATSILLGKNMQAAKRQVSPLNIITRVIPLGAKVKKTETDADGNQTEVETDERLTLVGYTPPGGTEFTNPWIDDEEKIKALGIVCGTLDFSDVTEQANLYTKAKNFMQNENRLELSHTVTALDLKEAGYDIDSLNYGDSYPVKNNLIGLDETLRVIKKSFDINTPYKGSLTFGDKKATLSSIQKDANKRIEENLEQIRQEVQNVSNNSSMTASQVTSFGSKLVGTVEKKLEERYKDVVTTKDLEKLEERISYKTEETAEGLKQTFTTQVKETQTTLEGDVSSRFEKLESYIRYFSEDGTAYIELGEEYSDLKLRLANKKIYFSENGIEFAYMSKSQLFITDVTVLKRLIIGKFAFIPRENGNLSFVKVG